MIAGVCVPPGREHRGHAVTAGARQLSGTEPSLRQPAHQLLPRQNLTDKTVRKQVEALVHSAVDYRSDVTESSAIPCSGTVRSVIGTEAYEQNKYQTFTNSVTFRHKHCAIIQTKHRL